LIGLIIKKGVIINSLKKLELRVGRFDDQERCNYLLEVSHWLEIRPIHNI